jgi:hypothetical protein
VTSAARTRHYRQRIANGRAVFRIEADVLALERIAAKIVAVQLNKVEGIQEHGGVVSAVTNAIEARHSGVIAGDGLAVDDAGARAKTR